MTLNSFENLLFFAQDCFLNPVLISILHIKMMVNLYSFEDQLLTNVKYV